ncbi:replication initiator protein A [Heyndrickxia sp. FSL W8-0496]|uniref:replication initiator protein A n=1 Tax=Heyndrickxia sp. FSL W8-0496 TaxID=2954702 RepID=UPI0030FCBA08
MDKNRMIHKNDEIKRRFYQVDKLLLENPKYENLSEGAVLTWSILRDRMELSKLNADVYSDEEGYLFLIFTDEELAEIIHRTRKTANTRKKELEKFGLLYSVRMGNQEPNRIYLLEPEACDPSEYISEKYRQKKKAELIEKQIEKAKSQKKKYVMLEVTEEDENNYPQGGTLAGVMKSKKGTSVKSKKGTSGRVKKVHPDVQNLPTIDTKIFNTDLNKTEDYEEEEGSSLETSINIHFPNLIKEVLGSNGLYDDNMIAQIILEMKNNGLSFLTKKEMLDQHRKMSKKRDSGEEIWDWAKYFVGGILKNRLSESSSIRQNRLIEAKKFNEYSNKKERNALPFYNWLES